MDENIQAIIESVLGPMRLAVGKAWVEPERVRLTVSAKVRARTGVSLSTVTISLDLPGKDVVITREAGQSPKIASKVRR